MKKIDVLEYASQILQGVKGGVLLTTKSGEQINTMTISWGMLGIEWHRNIFTVFVREGRYTRELLDKAEEFTINIPVGEFDKSILGYAGGNSGRDGDKIKALGLTPMGGVNISTPGIKELPLTLECKLFYRQVQDVATLPREVYEQCYPQGVESSFPRANRDAHIAFYGEIVGAYIL